jgi:Do/DeqQ family serine protease
MQTWKQRFQSTLTRPLLASVLVVAVVVGVTSSHLLKPQTAHASPAPAAAPLDDHSVDALLALDRAMETLAARVTPAIVNVAVTSKAKEGPQGNLPEGLQQFFGPFGHMMPQQQQPQIEHGIGSGAIISPDGYIVTNNHVIDGATDIRVTMTDRRILKAKLIGADPLTDIAVIKVEGSNFPSVPWGDSTELRPGETVLAFGNPYGFRFTVTRGIVSALNRPNPWTDNPRKPGQFIQTDAAINPGNSGGPLVDARGEVIGINTFLVSPSGTFSGMGFAIPTNIVRPTVEALIRDGKITHGYMGIGITDITPENSKFFDRKENTGALVTQVEPDSPGAKAGLKIGDVVTQLDGKNISDAGDLQVQVGQKSPGTKISLGVEREGKNITVPVTLEAMGARDGKGTDISFRCECGKTTVGNRSRRRDSGRPPGTASSGGSSRRAGRKSPARQPGGQRWPATRRRHRTGESSRHAVRSRRAKSAERNRQGSGRAHPGLVQRREHVPRDAQRRRLLTGGAGRERKLRSVTGLQLPNFF